MLLLNLYSKRLNVWLKITSQPKSLSLMPSNQIKNQHLMWRAGFGPAAEQLEQLKNITPQQLFKALQKASAKKNGLH